MQISRKLLSKSKTKQNSANFYLPGEELGLRREDMFASWENQKSGFAGKGRIVFAIGCCSVAYLMVAFRLLGTCVLPNMYDNVALESSYTPKQNIHRADIMDRNDNIVATSLPTKDLDAKIKNVLAPRETAQKLVEIFPELNFEKVYKKLKYGRGTVTIKRNLSPHQQSVIMAMGNPGLEFRPSEKRIYPHKNLFAHIVGTANVDNVGTAGIEKGLDNRITSSQVPLKLSVDLGVQDTIRTILEKNVQKFDAFAATAILLEAKTGQVVAMVSLPDYDPNDIKDMSAVYNHATARVYEPGSVLKVFNTAMALDSGKVKISEKFDATEPLRLKYNTIYDYRGENRWLSVEETLIHSSNIASARIALQSGFGEQYSFLEKIKFLERLDMELVETAKPLVPNKNRWSVSDSTVATIGYGYGISVSPMHLIAAYAAVVNGGIYNNPSLVINDKSGKQGVRIISDTTSKQMRKLMRAVVTQGSGKKANVLGYEVGGKTGTANKLGPDGKYMKKKVNTTFLSAFPISDPQYALLVMMDDPKATKETFGFTTSGWNAVPTASEIITAIAPQLNVPANYDLEELRNNKIIEASFER